MERRLGRGLGSLLGTLDEEVSQKADAEIAVDRIRPNPRQPRKTFDEVELSHLAESLRVHGVLQPVVVREAASGFELISGERRYRAARMIGLAKIPAVVRRGVTDQDMLELALVENVQRQDLDPIERALAFREMMDTLGITQEEVAVKVGMQRASVANHLRLLELPRLVQDAITRGLLSLGHAKAILAVKSSDARIALMERAVREGMSVRQVEAAARSQVDQGEAAGRATAPESLRPRASWISSVEAKLRDALGTKVSIRNGRGYKGKVIVEYFDRATFERLCSLLAPDRDLD